MSVSNGAFCIISALSLSIVMRSAGTLLFPHEEKSMAALAIRRMVSDLMDSFFWGGGVFHCSVMDFLRFVFFLSVLSFAVLFTE